MSQFSRYRPLVASLAEQALDRVVRTASDDAADIRLGLPTARVLLHDAPADDAWHASLARLADLHHGVNDERPLRSPGGQWRDVYWPLVVHLYLRSFTKVRPTLDEPTAAETHRLLTRAVEALMQSPDTGTISFGLWRALCLAGRAGLALPMAAMEQRQGKPCPTVNNLLTRDDARPTTDALHAQDEDEPLDFWTYRELAGLHALHRLAQLADRADWHARAAQVATFHLNHTQPDYTTYEPWGLAAFAGSVETSTFAEQQLHDATVHLSYRDGSGAATIALLLADAFDAMGEASLDM